MASDVSTIGGDVVHSEAFKLVNKLLEDEEISRERADQMKRQYEELHKALIQVMIAEKHRLDDAKALKRQLEEQKENNADAQEDTSDTQAAIQVMKEDEEQAQAEVALAQEKEQLRHLEMIELQRHRDEVMQQVQLIQEEHRQRLLPKIQQLQEEINAIQTDMEIQQAKLDDTSDEMAGLSDKLAEMVETKLHLSALKREQDTEFNKVNVTPEKARRQAEFVQSLLTQLEKQRGDQIARLEATELAVQAAQEQVRGMEDEYSMLMAASERGHFGVEARQRSIDELKKELASKQVDSERILGDQVELELRLKMKDTELRKEMDNNNVVIKEKDHHLKRYRKLENVIKVQAAVLPGLQSAKQQLLMDIERLTNFLSRQKTEVAAAKKESDVHMSFYLTEEQTGKEKNMLFVISHEEIMALERNVEEYTRDEAQKARIVGDLSSARDKAARQLSLQYEKVRECKEQSALKEVVGKDMKSMRKAIVSRVKDFQQLYDMVKNQRNRFVNLIQAARQGISEMKEKHKILTNELDILRAESIGKDQLLQESRSKHEMAIAERNSLRAKLNKFMLLFKEKQSKVDEQIVEIDKLNAIINTAEKDMMRLKKQYEVIVEARNYTGIMLIDRNDELCILYEKSNVQESVCKTGDMELTRLEDEARMLRIEISELKRSIHVTRQIIPTIPHMDHDVASLQKELLLVQREGLIIEEQLENPQNEMRWRQLPGRAPDKDELRTKLNHLEERLNDKKEQLLERELILEEITGLSNKLRIQAASGRADTLELARKVNDYQNRMRAITRKMMATISELSMYQATALKLTAEKQTVEDDVSAARIRLADGLAPTEDAELEWQRMEREKEIGKALKEAQAEAQKVLEAKGVVVATTADPRPNAYIPEKLGIPKPYGTFAPFKPQDPGSTMRHIRKPLLREIVI